MCELATGSAGSERVGFAKAVLPNWILIKESQWPFMFQWYLLGNSLFVAAPRTLAPHWDEGSDWQVRGVAPLWDCSLVFIPHQHLIEDASQSLSSPSPAPCTDLRAWPCPRPAPQMCPCLSFPGDWAPPFLLTRGPEEIPGAGGQDGGNSEGAGLYGISAPVLFQKIQRGQPPPFSRPHLCPSTPFLSLLSGDISRRHMGSWHSLASNSSFFSQA